MDDNLIQEMYDSLPDQINCSAEEEEVSDLADAALDALCEVKNPILKAKLSQFITRCDEMIGQYHSRSYDL